MIIMVFDFGVQYWMLLYMGWVEAGRVKVVPEGWYLSVMNGVQ